jgi:hypothetical protein
VSSAAFPEHLTQPACTSEDTSQSFLNDGAENAILGDEAPLAAILIWVYKALATFWRYATGPRYAESKTGTSRNRLAMSSNSMCGTWKASYAQGRETGLEIKRLGVESSATSTHDTVICVVGQRQNCPRRV